MNRIAKLIDKNQPEFMEHLAKQFFHQDLTDKFFTAVAKNDMTLLMEAFRDARPFVFDSAVDFILEESDKKINAPLVRAELFLESSHECN